MPKDDSLEGKLSDDWGPRKLPEFEGYTVDERLREFRKIPYGKEPEFIPFDSEQGQQLLARMSAAGVDSSRIIIIRYTDQDAINDGVLIPFVTKTRDTLHRITSNAFHELSDYHRARSYRDYEDEQFYRFFFNELLPLVPEAHRVWSARSILKTTYEFQVTKRDDEILWYVPNEIGGITMMLPTDY